MIPVTYLSVNSRSLNSFFALTLSQALFDLENTNQELKSELKDLYINQAVYVSAFLLLPLSHYMLHWSLSKYLILSLQEHGHLWKPQGYCDLRPIQIEESFPQDPPSSR